MFRVRPGAGGCPHGDTAGRREVALELRHLRYFVAVAEELNVTHAAERLHTAQPSLSQQIRQLEDILGVRLFSRKNHRLTLTDAGRIFLREARDILRHAENATDLARAAARGEAGQVTISFVPSATARIFPRLLPVFQSRYPEIDLQLRGLPSPEQLRGIRDCRIDVGFVREATDDARLTSRNIVREPLLAVLPSASPAAAGTSVRPEMLKDVALIEMPRHAEPVLHDTVRAFCAAAGIGRRRTPSFDSLEAILNMVAAGIGFALLPDYVRHMVPSGAVALPLLCTPVPDVHLYVVHRKDDKRPAVRTMLAMLDEVIRSHGSDAPGALRPSRCSTGRSGRHVGRGTTASDEAAEVPGRAVRDAPRESDPNDYHARGRGDPARD